MAHQIIIPKAGGNQVLKHESITPSTQLLDDSVRVSTSYSGINFADIVMRLGFYQDAPPFPFVPGYELSGEISEVGSSVTSLKVGDKVMAGTKFNGYSSELILPASQVVKIGKLSLEQAAALPVSFLTSYLVFIEQGRVRDGDKILIDCATGALGQLSFSLLKKYKLDIVGLTSSESKKKIIEEKGGRAFTHEEFKNSNEKGFNIVLNSIGGASIMEHYGRLAPSGKIVCIGASSLFENGNRSLFRALKVVYQMPKFNIIKLMNDCKGVMGLNVLRLFDGTDYLMDLLKKAQEFDLTPHVDKVFDATDVSAAHAYLESKQARGKVLLKW
ncbi:MAG: NADPH:quinone reductase-like Zn-dependent oxidoreductase [Bacteriovoracaceae bacterium]|jgi:NADPH:quinone reductase-like Zn-dependent oxidoreductase